MNDRWYDLGFRRINQGADLAMLAAIELRKSIGSLLETKDNCELLLKEDARERSFVQMIFGWMKQ